MSSKTPTKTTKKFTTEEKEVSNLCELQKNRYEIIEDEVEKFIQLCLHHIYKDRFLLV